MAIIWSYKVQDTQNKPQDICHIMHFSTRRWLQIIYLLLLREWIKTFQSFHDCLISRIVYQWATENFYRYWFLKLSKKLYFYEAQNDSIHVLCCCQKNIKCHNCLSKLRRVAYRMKVEKYPQQVSMENWDRKKLFKRQ